jgi:hypothetical protein
MCRFVLVHDMNLMLYAPYGRTGTYMLQEFCKRIDIGPSDANIRGLITALKLLPPGHPLESLLRQVPDFRSEAALADALLHPQDRAYSVPQLFDFLKRGGLTFGRWVKQAPYSLHCGGSQQYRSFPGWQRFPCPSSTLPSQLSRGTMIRHSFVAYRNDRSGEPHPINFAGGCLAWLRACSSVRHRMR